MDFILAKLIRDIDHSFESICTHLTMNKRKYFWYQALDQNNSNGLQKLVLSWIHFCLCKTINKLHSITTYCADTSRLPRAGEVNGKEYFFVSREQLEDDINAGKLLEYGEYKGNLYGTSSDSVQSIVNAGYVCLLNPHFQVRLSPQPNAVGYC